MNTTQPKTEPMQFQWGMRIEVREDGWRITANAIDGPEYTAKGERLQDAISNLVAMTTSDAAQSEAIAWSEAPE